MDLLEQDDPDWYLVKLSNGEIGLAPSNYVQPIDDVNGGGAYHEHQHAEIEQEQEPAEEEEQQYQAPIPTPPPIVAQTSIPPPPVQPVLSQPVSHFSCIFIVSYINLFFVFIL